MATMRSINRSRGWSRWLRPARLLVAFACLSGVSLAGVGIASSGAGASSKPTLTIWYDTARKPMVEAYIKAHPAVHVVAVLKDGDTNGDGTYQSATGGRTSTSASRTTTRRRSLSRRSTTRPCSTKAWCRRASSVSTPKVRKVCVRLVTRCTACAMTSP